MAALPLWRRLEEEAGVELVTTTGGLDAGKKLDDHVAALRECGVAYELLSGLEIHERFPAVTLPEDEPVLFQPEAGIVRADATVWALADGAKAHGAELHEDTQVTHLRVLGDEVELATDNGIHRARVAVVAAGGWVAPLLATAGIELEVSPTRETLAYFGLEGDVSVPTLVEWRDPPFYALPSPGVGLKAGLHHAGPVTDPSREGDVSDEIVARLSEHVAARFPTVSPTPHHAETCIYTNTADERFILERRGPIVIGSACSGHGFKFAPLIGQRLASLALDGSS